MWRLNDAIEEIKQLETKLAAVGFHCAKNHFESAFIKDCGGSSQIRDDKKFRT